MRYIIIGLVFVHDGPFGCVHTNVCDAIYFDV